MKTDTEALCARGRQSLTYKTAKGRPARPLNEPPRLKVWRHCEDKGSRDRTVTLRVKFADFELISRSRTLASAIGSRDELSNVSVDLLRVLFPMQKAVRLLGVSVSGFAADDIHPKQIALAI
ncbi:hypothetical protein [Bradyrhizobium sp. th.b2]|uniref:DinB/UmuC family translesion DNA polymerase n=1 Tax=Bradyrhizobium sp. th-b2 TaxID=172088 RepID=UPI00048EFF7D|nr:hypothetical protein [Bradyrhizobium sp. th.b2]